MPRHVHREPEDEDSDEYDAYRDYDPEDAETYPQGLYDDDGPPLVSCPYCREEIQEESEQCPRCRMYISKEDAPSASKPHVWAILMVLALLAAGLMMLG